MLKFFIIEMFQIWAFPADPRSQLQLTAAERITDLREVFNQQSFNWRVPTLVTSLSSKLKSQSTMTQPVHCPQWYCILRKVYIQTYQFLLIMQTYLPHAQSDRFLPRNGKKSIFLHAYISKAFVDSKPLTISQQPYTLAPVSKPPIPIP